MPASWVTVHVKACFRRLGATLVTLRAPGLSEANARLITVLFPQVALIHAALIASNPSGYAPGTRAQIEALFAEVDVLLAPTVPFVAPREDPVIVDDQDSEMLSSGFANLTRHSSLSKPCGAIEGLPIGMQLTGPFGQDRRLLAMGAAVERL